jgi:ubiquinone/menaquinone biosynthesis C-methylase UbiE
MKTPYSNLERNCQNLHGFSNKDIEKFVELGKLKQGMFVLDAMCGEGSIGKIISKNKKVNLYLLDDSEFQINKAKEKIKDAEFKVASILETEFDKSFFDRIFIRSGIQEIPQHKQIKLYKEILRVLKKEGMFINWTVKLNEKNKKAFQKLADKKDEIAGFDELLKNRYFMTKAEFEEDLKKAGFSNVRFFDLGINYTLSTKKWFEVDFKGDKSKLKKLNDYIRGLGSIQGIEIKDLGEDIQIIVPALISVSKK